jgi:DNA-binding protein H-NS
MATANLRTMDVPALLDLQKRVDEVLAKRRVELERQLRELGGGGGGYEGGGRRRTSPLAGKRVLPKYRGPAGETWAGRGARPRWLVAAMKEEGKKLTDFLIEKSKGRRKPRAKR